MHLVLRIGFFILLPFIGFSQVIADFEANTTTGCGALQVVFIDKVPVLPAKLWHGVGI